MGTISIGSSILANDPRMFGQGDVFEKYGFASDMWDQFYEKYQRGEKIRTGWVLPSDYEKEKLD